MSKWTSPRQVRRQRIKMRIRKRIVGTPERPRLVVYRSLKQIYAQVVDDSQSRTLFTVSSLAKDIQAQAGKTKGKTDVAKTGRQSGRRRSQEAQHHECGVRPERLSVPRPRESRGRRSQGSGTQVLTVNQRI